MFLSLEETKNLIKSGKVLHIAADDSLLKQLPEGKWIGGTTPYFITNEGGVLTKDKLFVNELDIAVDCKVKVYDKNDVLNLNRDAYENGMIFLLIPFASEVAIHYSKEAPNNNDILMTPVVGWITGFDLDDENAKAKVYDGTTGIGYEDKAVAMHLSLPDDKSASIGVVNIFDFDKNTSKIEFFDNTLSVQKCLVDGQEVVFADYLINNNINTKLPLVADYNSVYINTSIKDVQNDNKIVELYAPVFTGKEYYFAGDISDYKASFDSALKNLTDVKPLFSCNCILNYLYGELEGKSTAPFEGPVTFGEIAYQLLNQTLVYVEII